MTTIHCNSVRSRLQDLLFDPAPVSAEVHSHLAGCPACTRELDELRATMGLLDSWHAPEPSPYFLTRFEARLREQQEAEPTSWLARQMARLRSSMVDGPRLSARPLAAMALTVMLLVGGGTYLGVTDWTHTPQQDNQTAVVGDLQTMDSNAQLLDRLESLSDENGN